MMKSNSLTRLWAVLVLGLTFACTALATPAASPSDGGGVPSAPEPSLIVLAICGLALGGGYVLWRRRHMHKKANA